MTNTSNTPYTYELVAQIAIDSDDPNTALHDMVVATFDTEAGVRDYIRWATNGQVNRTVAEGVAFREDSLLNSAVRAYGWLTFLPHNPEPSPLDR